MTSHVLTAVPLYLETEAHASDSLLEQLWKTSVAEAPARRAAAVETLRQAAASFLDAAADAKTFADWRNVFEESVSAYIAAAEFFTYSEPVQFSFPVFMVSDKRRYAKAVDYSQNHECYGGDRTVELPAPNGYARVSLERIPPSELIAEHMLTLSAFENSFKEMLKPAKGLFGKLHDAFAIRAELAALEALVDNLLYTLCGETDVKVDGNRLEVFCWSRRNVVALKLQVLLNILDESSPYVSVQ